MTYHEYCVKEKKKFLKKIQAKRFIVLRRCLKCKCPVLVYDSSTKMNIFMNEASFETLTSLGIEILCAECSSENVLFGHNHFEHNQYLLKMMNFRCMNIAKLEDGIPKKSIYVDLINDKFCSVYTDLVSDKFCSIKPFLDINFENNIKQQIMHDFKIANYFLFGT